MMAKFSVKKPLTVLVAVIAILVLGFVSFTNMTPDLLPNIDLPYIMIMTTYPGSTPEKVEMVVTKPLEQTMATLENIESVNSVSSANYSMVTLEFAQDANMDSATVDILQKINIIEEYWDDTIGTPFLLKINPSMLPVMIAAVDMEGMEIEELSAFTEEVLLNKLEGTNGVADVSAEGLVEKTIQVELSPAKIAELNRGIHTAVDESFEEAQQELDDAKSQINGQIAKINDAMAKIRQGIEGMSGAADFSTQQEKEKLEAMLAIYEEIALLLAQAADLQLRLDALTQMQATIDQSEQDKVNLQAQIDSYTQLQNSLATLRQAQEGFEQQIAEIEAREITAEYTQEQKDADIQAVYDSPEYINNQAALAEAEAQLAATGLTEEGLGSAIGVLQFQLQQTQAVLDNLDTQLAQMGLSRGDIQASITELESAQQQILQSVEALESTVGRLELGEILIVDALMEMEKQKMLANFQISSTVSQLTTGQAALTQALAELNKAQDQLDEAKETMHDKMQLGEIVTMDMVSAILMAQNFAMPAGYVEQDGVKHLVSVGEEITSPTELENLLLLDLGLDGVDPIYLRDVATVQVLDNIDSLYGKVNGRDGILLSFTKQSNYATAEASDNIREKFSQLSEQYPGLQFVTMMDQGEYIYVVVNTIIENLLLGALFAIIILFLFLKDLKPTLITLCSIPISVVFAIALMYFSGVTLNMISLSGLAVAVGMLVDNSVVVIENIYRLRSKGVSALRAAVLGAGQVSGAIAASTLTTICVFLPIVFVQGITRQLFTDMALTLAYALLASLVVALTLVPAMSSRMLKNAKQRPNKLLDKALVGYQKSLRWTLNHKVVILGGAAILLVASVGLSFSKGFSFMPEMDMSQLTVTLQMPDNTPLAETKKAADEVMEAIGNIEEVDMVGGMLDSGNMLGLSIGGGGGSNTDPTSITIYAMLDEKAARSSREVSDEINGLFAAKPYEVYASGSSDMGSMMEAMGGSGVTIKLYGENSDTLLQTAKEMSAVLEKVEGVANVDDGIGKTDPEIRFVVDKQKAMEYELTVAQVYEKIATALQTEKNATSITYEGENYDVMVVSGVNNSLTPSYIRNYSFKVTLRNGDEKQVYLSEITQVLETETAQSIRRENQRRYISLTAEVESGYNISHVTSSVEKAMDNYRLPAGVQLEYAGENETIMEAFTDLIKMLLLGVLLVYLIMVAQFQSLKSPFIVMFTIPLAFTGGLFALVLGGMEISVVALIGFVMLVGIIVNNGIVLVDYINQLRVEGHERREAIVQAGVTRMRPILMTSITTVLGLSTMAVGMGTGAELMQPVAVVCIGGLVYATLLTLYVVPAIYDIINRKELRVVKDSDLEAEINSDTPPEAETGSIVNRLQPEMQRKNEADYPRKNAGVPPEPVKKAPSLEEDEK